MHPVSGVLVFLTLPHLKTFLNNSQFHEISKWIFSSLMLHPWGSFCIKWRFSGSSRCCYSNRLFPVCRGSERMKKHAYLAWYWAVPEIPLSPPFPPPPAVDQIGNPVVNTRWAWQETHEVPLDFVNCCLEFQENHRSLAKFWKFPRFWISRDLESWNSCWWPSWKSWNF